MNIISNMEQIADLIIRPNRYLYKPVDLGPKTITLTDNTTVYHQDFQVKNTRGLTLKCSLYSAYQSFAEVKKIFLYLHCNSGCRIQGLAYLNIAIKNGFSYVVFDFAGSGVSDGRYVSLGYHQVDDIKVMIKYLRKKINQNAQFVLWGRSMGAVAALRYLMIGKNQNIIKAAVFDSPFHSLKQLFVAIGRQKTNFPKIVLDVALKYLKPIILKKAKFDIDEVHLEDAQKINQCPGIFIASKNDSLIPFSQMDAIFKQYKGKKQMLFVQESHNQARNPAVIEDAFKTLNRFLEQRKQIISQPFYRSQIHSKEVSKEVSKKKLQLTIKSYSQKALILPYSSNQPAKQNANSSPRKHLKQISFPQLEKRQISCLFQKRKKLKNSLSHDYSQQNISLNSSITSKKALHKPQITIRKFFKDQNQNTSSHSHINLIKLNSNKQANRQSKSHFFGNQKSSRECQRKTMQHIASKKPPFVQNNRIFQLRNSFQSKYKTQFRK